MLSRDSNWVLQLKFSRTWCPWAVWSVGFCSVRFAIYSPGRARGTAKPECFDMFRVTDRPATYARAKLHEFNPNRRGERPRFIETLPIDHELRGGLLITAEPAVGCRSFDTAADFGHFAFATFSFASSALSRLINRRLLPFSLHTDIILGPHVCEQARPAPSSCHQIHQIGPSQNAVVSRVRRRAATRTVRNTLLPLLVP